MRVTSMVLCCAASVLFAGCATQAPRSRSLVESVDGYGFTITEDVRLDGDLLAQYDRSVQLLAQEQYAQGIAVLERVTAAAPDVTAPHINLGIAYARSGKLEQAEGSLRRAIELNPGHPIAHNELGMVYRRTGRFAEARASYERALAIYPEFHYARRNLAILCDIYLKDLRCALENYEHYEAAVPDDEEVAMWVADVRNRAGQ